MLMELLVCAGYLRRCVPFCRHAELEREGTRPPYLDGPPSISESVWKVGDEGG